MDLNAIRTENKDRKPLAQFLIGKAKTSRNSK